MNDKPLYKGSKNDYLVTILRFSPQAIRGL